MPFYQPADDSASLRTITAEELDARLRAPGELALLDVGEEGQFGLGHLLQACHIPYSLLEMQAPVLVPRRNCPVVLTDHGGGVAALAARRLAGLGYTDIAVLHGGAAAWAESGRQLFQGTYVPSKAFGEWVEHALGTPTISPQELHGLLARGADVRVLDPRTVQEHAARHIPGAISCPGAELAYRFDDLVPSAQSLVVVACGGRTRGLVGAQSLISVGVPNRVVALADGNHGWQLAGFGIEEGLRQGYGPVSPAARDRALGRAGQLVQAQGLSRVDAATVRRWQSDPDRTTVLLDVRTAEEYRAGHFPGARHAPGGQLLQATDRWLGTLGARLVLLDGEGVRAAVTANWLRHMGWEVHVMVVDTQALVAVPGEDSAQGALAAVASAGADEAARVVAATVAPPDAGPAISAQDAAAMLADGGQAVSLDRSADFLAAHPPGAIWANRARLEGLHALLQAGRVLVLFSEDGRAATLAAHDLREAAPDPDAQVNVVQGGLRAWRQAGLPLHGADADALPQAERIDVLYWMHDRRSGNKEAMRGYLEWERGLLAQLSRAGFAFGAPRDDAAFDKN